MGYASWRMYQGQVRSRNWTQGKSNKWRYQMSGVPYVGDFIRAEDSGRFMDDYLRNTGLSWDDVKYPSMNVGAGGMAHAVSNVGMGALSAGTTHALMRMYRTYRPTSYRGIEYA